MIEITYLEFLRNPTKYSRAVFDRDEQLLVVHGTQKLVILSDHAVTLLKTALSVASSAIDDDPAVDAVIDNM